MRQIFFKSLGAAAIAGYISIIPIAYQFANEVDTVAKPLLPLSKMQQIQAFIKQFNSPHARISVKPPVFEKVRIRCKVKYKTIPGADTHLYTTQLTDIINQYLSPWAFGNSDIQFTSAIVASALIQLLDAQSFVDFITDFQMDQLLLNPQTDAEVQVFAYVKEIVPQTDYTLFLPNNNHSITELP